MTDESSQPRTEENRFDLGAGREDYDPGDGPDREIGYTIHECRVCDDTLLAVNSSDGTVTCHGEPMAEITDWALDVRSPELRQVLLDAFGLPKAGLDICLCVIGEGPLSSSEIADRLDYDRSTVSRYLKQLVDIGLLQRSELILSDTRTAPAGCPIGPIQDRRTALSSTIFTYSCPTARGRLPERSEGPRAG